jgi:hypothetical protein
MIQYSSLLLILLLIILTIIIVKEITINNNINFSKYFDSSNNLNYDIRNFKEGFKSKIDNDNKIPQEFIEDKLDIKKTNSYKLIFSNDKYSVWEPRSVDNYAPIGHIVTKKNKKPNGLAILVNKEQTMSVKPDKFNIICITNNNWGIWQPICENLEYVSLGNIYSKDYPSKYSVRLINKKFLTKSDLSSMIIENKINKKDKGYEIWSIRSSDLFTVNNKNNINEFDSLKNIFCLNYSLLNVKKQLYIKYTLSYKKIMSYKDDKLEKTFSIWRPVPPKDFCSLGDVILDKNVDPNNMLQTIVVHKSFCKYPTSFGINPVIKINKKSKEYTIWKPEAPENYCFLGHICIKGSDEPMSEELIACIPVDYVNTVKDTTHNLVWNNVNEENPKSLWMSYLNILSCNNKYIPPETSGLVINRDFTTSDIDLMDDSQSILLHFKKNNKLMKPLDIIYTKNLIVQNIARKFDIEESRVKIDSFDLNDKKFTLTILPRKIETNSLLVDEIIDQIEKSLKLGDIKIFNEDKSQHFIVIYDGGRIKESLNEIKLDNSDYKLSFD